MKWEDGFTIKVRGEEKEVVISANKEGLISLANQLKALANDSIGSHIHFDENNSLEDSSTDLIIERIG